MAASKTGFIKTTVITCAFLGLLCWVALLQNRYEDVRKKFDTFAEHQQDSSLNQRVKRSNGQCLDSGQPQSAQAASVAKIKEPPAARSATAWSNRSCCNSYQYNQLTRYFCSKYCSDSCHLCCSSAKLRSGKWERGCCSMKTDDGGRSIGWSVGSIIGGAIGGMVISVIIDVVCHRRKLLNFMYNPERYLQQQQGSQQPEVPHPPPAVVESQPVQGQHLPMGANQQAAQEAPPPAYQPPFDRWASTRKPVRSRPSCFPIPATQPTNSE